jgi:hypothetical protein
MKSIVITCAMLMALCSAALLFGGKFSDTLECRLTRGFSDSFKYEILSKDPVIVVDLAALRKAMELHDKKEIDRETYARMFLGAYTRGFRQSRGAHGILLPPYAKIKGKDFGFDGYVMLYIAPSTEEDGMLLINFIRKTGDRRIIHAHARVKMTQTVFHLYSQPEEKKSINLLCEIR